MIHPDDVEDGEIEFDADDGLDIWEQRQEARYYDELDLNKPRKSDGFAPADFLYDPIGKDRE